MTPEHWAAVRDPDGRRSALVFDPTRDPLHDAAVCAAIPPDAFGADDAVIVSHPGLPNGHVHVHAGDLAALRAAGLIARRVLGEER